MRGAPTPTPSRTSPNAPTIHRQDRIWATLRNHSARLAQRFSRAQDSIRVDMPQRHSADGSFSKIAITIIIWRRRSGADIRIILRADQGLRWKINAFE
jgi:hypothetical protein